MKLSAALISAAQSRRNQKSNSDDIAMVANTVEIFAVDTAENVQTLGEWLNTYAPSREVGEVELVAVKREYVTARGEVRVDIDQKLVVKTADEEGIQVGQFEFFNNPDKSGRFELTPEELGRIAELPTSGAIVLRRFESVPQPGIRVATLRDSHGNMRYQILRGKRYAKWYIVR